MYPNEMTQARPTPHWARVCLNSFLILGIFAMHNVLTGDAGVVAAHHEVTSMATVAGGMATVAAPGQSATEHPQLVANADDGDTSMSECGGLTMLCIAMLVGISAFILFRRASRERVLWQLPPPCFYALGQALAPTHNLSPLQRTAVLRR